MGILSHEVFINMKDVKTVALAEQYLAGPGSWIKSACSLDVTDTIFIKYIYIYLSKMKEAKGQNILSFPNHWQTEAWPTAVKGW